MKPTLEVLLIEDSENDSKLIQRAIQISNGFELNILRVDTKPDLARALRDDYFDFIICDVQMPQLDIMDVMSAMGSFEVEAPFAVVTGSISSEQAKELFGEKTPFAFISKDHLWQLGPLIKNVRQSEDRQYQIIEAFVQALELRDSGTREHSDRVTSLSQKLGVAMGITKRKLLALKRGALLHDIGKIGISDSILLKPNILTEAEFTIMKTHARKGYELIMSTPLPRDLVEIPWCHHEKWNGTGYPRGLMGDQIPLSARIFAVVDVYDALTSLRPYHEAMPNGNALKYIESEAGISFDPEIVKAFLTLFEVKGK